MDYLVYEQAILSRLKGAATLVHEQAILPAASLDGVLESSQRTPALHVVYLGGRPAPGPNSNAGNGGCQIAFQRWMVVVVDRSVAGDQSGVATRARVGLIAGEMLAALQGFSAGVAGFGPLIRVAEPPPVFRNGFGYFPHLFENRVTTLGTEND
jgi:hypothetical protein